VRFLANHCFNFARAAATKFFLEDTIVTRLIIK
jgi:hypothetical protein